MRKAIAFCLVIAGTLLLATLYAQEGNPTRDDEASRTANMDAQTPWTCDDVDGPTTEEEAPVARFCLTLASCPAGTDQEVDYAGNTDACCEQGLCAPLCDYPGACLGQSECEIGPGKDCCG